MTQSDRSPYDAAEFVTAEAELELSRVQYLPKQGESPQPKALTYPDFTYRHHWGDYRGWVRFHLTGSIIYKTTNVFASITEADPIVTTVDPVPTPFLGGAAMSVANISPHNGGVWVLASINWNTPLYTAVSYLFVNP